MRKYILLSPFAAYLIALVFVGMKMNSDIDEKGGIPIDSEGGFEGYHFLGPLIWITFMACLLTVPIVSKKSLALGYAAILFPFVSIFLITLMP